MIMEICRIGGPVTWLIVASGIVALGVFVERALHLHRSRIRAEDFLKGIFNILRRGNAAEAVTICEETPGPVAYVVKTAILHRQDSREDMQRSVTEAGVGEISRMERRLVVVATVAQVAPLMGLLGTVLGLIEYAMVLQHQIVLIQAADVVGGLLQAMVATAAGLLVAIPCYVAFNLLVIKIDRIVLDMERAASEIQAFLHNLEAAASRGV